MPSLKLVAAALCGFATTAFAHGLVGGFVTDGNYNQGYISKFLNAGTTVAKSSEPYGHFGARVIKTPTDRRILFQWITTTS